MKPATHELEIDEFKCKINLQESYKTVPYLGRGNVDVGLESLRFGETLEKKSIVQLGEKSQQDVKKYPMDKKLKGCVNDPAKCIEESAVDG